MSRAATENSSKKQYPTPGLSIRNGATDSKDKPTDKAGAKGAAEAPLLVQGKALVGGAKPPGENGFQHFAIAMVASPESLFLTSFVTNEDKKRHSECLAFLSGLFQNQKGIYDY